MTTDQIAQIVVFFTGVSSLWCLASQDPKYRMWGGLIALIGEPFWFITTYTNKQWGIVILVFIYAANYLRIWYKNWQAHSAASNPNSTFYQHFEKEVEFYNKKLEKQNYDKFHL